VIRPVHAVDQQNVQPAIGIVVEEGAARSQSLRQVFGAECAAIVAELDSGRRSDVGEAEIQAGRGGERPRRGATQNRPAQERAPRHAILTRPWRMA